MNGKQNHLQNTCRLELIFLWTKLQTENYSFYSQRESELPWLQQEEIEDKFAQGRLYAIYISYNPGYIVAIIVTIMLIVDDLVANMFCISFCLGRIRCLSVLQEITSKTTLHNLPPRYENTCT